MSSSWAVREPACSVGGGGRNSSLDVKEKVEEDNSDFYLVGLRLLYVFQLGRDDASSVGGGNRNSSLDVQGKVEEEGTQIFT